MAQQPDVPSNHIVIDIEADDEPSRCCAVCMEPAEWVAVGPCGHGVVCVACAGRIRFFHNDLRCCICRRLCPVVVIAEADPSTRRKRGLGTYRHDRYHSAMGAYFEDQTQFEAMSKLCVKPPPCPTGSTSVSEEGATNVNLAQPSESSANTDANLGAPCPTPAACLCFGLSLIYLSVILTMILIFRLLFVMAGHNYQKVVIVLAFGLLTAGFTISMILIWHKLKNALNRDA